MYTERVLFAYVDRAGRVQLEDTLGLKAATRAEPFDKLERGTIGQASMCVCMRTEVWCLQLDAVIVRTLVLIHRGQATMCMRTKCSTFVLLLIIAGRRTCCPTARTSPPTSTPTAARSVSSTAQWPGATPNEHTPSPAVVDHLCICICQW